MAENSTMANALAVIAGFLSTGTSTPSNQAANQVKRTKLGTVLILAPSVPGSVETAG